MSGRRCRLYIAVPLSILALLLLLGPGAAPSLALSPVGDELDIFSWSATAEANIAVCPLSDGGFAAALARRPATGSAVDLYLRRFNAQGQPMEDANYVDQYLSASTGVDMAGIADNGLVLLWERPKDGAATQSLFFLPLDRDNQVIGGYQIINLGNGDISERGIKADQMPDGTMVMAWRSDLTSGQAAQLNVYNWSASTRQFTGLPPVEIPPGSILDVAGLAGGQVAAAVGAGASDGWGRGLVYSTSNPDQASAFWLSPAVSERVQANPVLAATREGGFQACWFELNSPSTTLLRGRAFDAEANAQGEPRDLVDREITDANQVLSLACAGLGQGSVLFWHDSSAGDPDIWGRYLGSDGAPASDAVRLNQTTEGRQVGVEAATLTGGQAVVIWLSQSPDGTGWGVRGRLAQ